MNALPIILWTLICILIVGILFINIAYLARTETQTITITDKGIKVDAAANENGAGTLASYLIYTRSGEVLTNKNSIWYNKWRSDELQGKLKIGKTYRVKTVGFRSPVLGLHKNILTATEIKKKK